MSSIVHSFKTAGCIIICEFPNTFTFITELSFPNYPVDTAAPLATL